ncbi:MAG: CHAT domain-containing protein [Phycisphaerae bacterium]|nr:CHAT domain-containing protein [Saprospiraceae bacterium]
MALSCTKNKPPALTPTYDYPKDAQALALYNQAVAFFPDNQDSVLFYARASATQAEKTNDWHTWGDAQRYILTACYYLGQSKATLETLPALKKQAENMIPRDSLFWSEFYNLSGAMYKDLGDFEKALEYGKNELKYYDKRKSKSDFGIASLIAGANNNIGMYYLGRGDYDLAWDYSKEACRLFESFPETALSDKILIYSNLGKIRLRQKNYADAIAWSQKALNLVKAQPSTVFVNDPGLYVNEADFNLDISNALIGNKESDKALPYLLQALKIVETHKITSLQPYILHSIGSVYTQQNLYDKAEIYLLHAMKAFDAKDAYYGKLCRQMGLLFQKKNDLWTALKWQQRALRSLSDTFPEQDSLANPSLKGLNAYYDFMHSLIGKGETLRLLAKQESKPVLLEASLATFDLATVVLDSMRTIYQEGSKQFWNQEARPVLEKAIGAALELRHSTGDDRYLAQAFGYSEKGKAYLLAEALRESAAEQKAGIPQELLDQEHQIKTEIALYKNKIFEESHKKSADQAKIVFWESEIHARQREEETLKAKLASAHPAYYQIKYGQKALGLTEIQQSLPENTGLLEYFQGDSATYAFYIDRQGAKALRCGTVPDMMRLLEGMQEDSLAGAVYSPAYINAFAKKSSDLYRALVSPVLDKIPEQLIIIPDGPLAYLPFELLLTAEASAAPSYDKLPYLLLKTCLRYEYSALLAFQKHAENHPTRFFDGYAPVYGHDIIAARGGGEHRIIRASEFGSLAKNREEVEAAAQLTGGKTIIGPKAQKAYFMLHAHEPRILHLAMHGFVDDSLPSFSGLVFTPTYEADSTNSILYANEVYNLHLNAELAVLSACNTGRGHIARGEGVISLARAFKYAGCHNVLMSLWQADDRATAEIMQGFYTYLKAGKGKSAAIRQAKLDYISRSKRKSHPFYWATFVLIGDDLPLQEKTSWLWYVGLAVLLLGGLYYGFWKRKKARRRVRNNDRIFTF